MNEINEIKSATSKYNVLCVDDEEKSKNELEGLLKLFFKKVYTANNGKEALKIYYEQQNEIDMIFTDINMPVMDGLEMTEKIKESNPLQHIISISALQDLQLYNKCINSGINGMIVKPITSSKLIDVLSKAVNKVQYLKRNELLNNKTLDEDNIKIESDIYFDDITGLNNKHSLDKYLLGNKVYSIIIVNIDNFDLINCKYGYKTGDQILKQLARLLKLLSSKEFKLFRVVSDEFVFLSSTIDQSKIEKLSKQIISTLESTKLQTDVDDINISCTIGISFGKGQEVLKQAHIAVKEARQIGKEKYYFFSNNSQIRQKQENNLKWLKKIKKTIKDDCVIPYYQPIIENKSGKILKYESLARILEVNRIVKPYYFLENAKLFNMIPNITKLMIKNVFEYIKDKEFEFSINITEDDLLDNSLVSYIEEMADKYKIKKDKVVFELLETITANDDKTILGNLTKLQTQGFKIALDDFGANHSNINILHSLEIEYIKIDGIFIENILEDEKSQKVVKSIIKLARSIGTEVVAESVSNEEIYNKIKELGIHYSQGYYTGKPKEFIN